jgi:hypothetical protein
MCRQTSWPGKTFLGVLSPEDRWLFFGLQAALSAPETRINRNRTLAILQEQFQAIRSFSVRNDYDDWRRLFLRGVAILSALTLAINKLIKAARGEFALKERLGTIKQIWRTTAFEFSMHNGKVPLVKGLNVAFGLITDHLVFLTSMRTFEFYAIFREQATRWETDLNEFQVRLQEYLEIQCRFVYLDGIFSSPTIRSKLGHAITDFRPAETEFMGLSKAVFQKKIMKDAMFMDKVVNSLQSLRESLPRVQKELSDYLEKQ